MLKGVILEEENIEYFDIVDEQGKVIGKKPRGICHNGSKLLHPVVHVHIFNSKRELLLQKRKLTKDIQPGKWDTSIGGHIQAGEPVKNAILREALEETGIRINYDLLKFLSKYIFESDVEREFVYSYVYNYEGAVIFQESEIDEVRFFKRNEVKELISKKMTTPNFVREFELLTDNNLFLKGS